MLLQIDRAGKRERSRPRHVHDAIGSPINIKRSALQLNSRAALRASGQRSRHSGGTGSRATGQRFAASSFVYAHADAVRTNAGKLRIRFFRKRLIALYPAANLIETQSAQRSPPPDWRTAHQEAVRNRL